MSPPPFRVHAPYKPFFLLGAALAWAGVLHWLLYAVGVLDHGLTIYHSIAQVQGFLMCFALGFLFTAIPRRTGTPGPRRWQMAVGLLCPIGTTLAAWAKMWALSQGFWLALVVLLIAFAVTRFRSATAARRPPNSFVWVPLSLLMGLAGSFLIAAYGVLGPDYFHWHQIGRVLLLQGMFLGLVVGVGGMLLPLITRGESSTDAAPGDFAVRAWHLVGALALVASLERQVAAPRLGFALTAAIVLVLLLAGARIHRPPTVPGAHRWLVWLSAWMLPLGYLLAAAAPHQPQAGLHVVFIGGFGLMVFSVATHVALAHGGREDLVRGRPWQVFAYGALFLAALAARVIAQFQLAQYVFWLGVAAACFLAGTLFWAALVLPVMFPRRPATGPTPARAG
jgi:uncharacterized protein involved in response to NO